MRLQLLMRVIALLAILVLLHVACSVAQAQKVARIECVEVPPLKGVCRLKVVVEGCEKVFVSSLEVDGMRLQNFSARVSSRADLHEILVPAIGFLSTRSHVVLVLTCLTGNGAEPLRVEGVVGALAGIKTEPKPSLASPAATEHETVKATQATEPSSLPPQVLTLSRMGSPTGIPRDVLSSKLPCDAPIFALVVLFAAVVYLIARKQT